MAIGSALDKMFTDGAASIIDQAIGAQSIKDVKEMTMFTAKSDYFSTFWSVINKALGYVKPFGYAFITTFFIMYLFDCAEKDQVTVDSLIKVLIELVIVIALIKNLDTIINTFLSISDTLIRKISGNAKGTTGITMDGSEIVNNWHETDTAFSIFLQSAVMWLFSKIAMIAIYFAAIARAIEVGWRTVFCPIGIANCFDGGANSKGIQYLKTLGCVILSGAAIYLTVALGFSIVNGMLTTVEDNTTIWLAVGAMLGTAGAAIGVSNKIRDLV